MPEQLKVTGIPQSITNDIYNEAKGIIENDPVLKGFGNRFYVQNTNDQNKPFQIIISDISNGSCKGATCPRFALFKLSFKRSVAQFIRLCYAHFVVKLKCAA